MLGTYSLGQTLPVAAPGAVPAEPAPVQSIIPASDVIKKTFNLKTALMIGGLITAGYMLFFRKKRGSSRRVSGNPYSDKAKYYHIRTRDPKSFQKGSFRTIDPGRKGHIKMTVGRPKGKKKTRTQKFMVEKRYVPKNKRAALKRMERRAERKPYKKGYVSKRLKKMGLVA